MTFPVGKRFVIPGMHRRKVAEPTLPSLPRRALNFGKSFIRNSASQLSGNPRAVTDETKLARQAICKTNTCGKYRASDGLCAQCGCPASKRGIIESKTELFAEFCPKGFWGPGEIKQAA